MRITIIVALAIASLSSAAQIRIDSVFSFQTDPAKKYSLYIPSTYDPATPNRLMLGLHPFNTSRWWAESWCDTLKVFAETNGLILACPDGGTDGKIDDDIDTAFTSALLDSMSLWYNIDQGKTYIMGFSWGGQTTYTYGLRHISRFGGMLPTGSAMSGTSMVTSVLANADSMPVYIVHGGNDSPGSRYTPIKDALTSNGAILNSLLMPGVGHTIDYPNRNQILTTAFQWIDSVNCSFIDTTTPPDTTVTIEQILANPIVDIYPNPNNGVFAINIISIKAKKVLIQLFSITGQLVYETNRSVSYGINELHFDLDKLPGGTYQMIVKGAARSWAHTILIE